jgi:hypothetical protein
MSRWSALGLRLVSVALLIVVAALGSMWAYVGYEAHRTRSMLADVSRVRLGDAEASVLPLVQRYRGVKWTQESLSPKENWLDKEEYEYQKSRHTDYRYEIEISPFETIFRRTGPLTQALRAVRAAFPARLRPVLGMRDWGTVAELSLRGSRVESVSIMTLVTGRSGWVGHRWELAEGMPEHDMRQKTYAIGAAFLTVPDAGDMMIENYFTPKSSEEEARAARQFNTGCLTSIKGCKGLCDVAPSAIEYLREHPEAAWGIITPKCP